MRRIWRLLRRRPRTASMRPALHGRLGARRSWVRSPSCSARSRGRGDVNSADALVGQCDFEAKMVTLGRALEQFGRVTESDFDGTMLKDLHASAVQWAETHLAQRSALTSRHLEIRSGNVEQLDRAMPAFSRSDDAE
eukprot:1947335-Pyramimonas_sp.AAC.1